jgi:hypothetical protein
VRPRMRIGLTGAGLGLLALVPACGAGSTAPAGPPSAHVKGGPVVKTMPVATADLTPLTLLSAAPAKNYDSVAWSLSGQPHGTDLVVAVPLGGCRRLVGARVDMDPRAVTIAVLATRPTRNKCVEVNRTAMALIRLPDPVDGRQTVHAPATG